MSERESTTTMTITDDEQIKNLKRLFRIKKLQNENFLYQQSTSNGVN